MSTRWCDLRWINILCIACVQLIDENRIGIIRRKRSSIESVSLSVVDGETNEIIDWNEWFVPSSPFQFILKLSVMILPNYIFASMHTNQRPAFSILQLRKKNNISSTKSTWIEILVYARKGFNARIAPFSLWQLMCVRGQMLPNWNTPNCIKFALGKCGDWTMWPNSFENGLLMNEKIDFDHLDDFAYRTATAAVSIFCAEIQRYSAIEIASQNGIFFQ